MSIEEGSLLPPNKNVMKTADHNGQGYNKK
jgi:hypothetical protein